jgi:F0F1-type ATP synthase assembly protein I
MDFFTNIAKRALMPKVILTPEQMRVIRYFQPARGALLYILAGIILGGIVGAILVALANKEWLLVVFIILGGIGGYFWYTKSYVADLMTDSEYDALIESKIAKSKERALAQIGLDEDEVKEIEPKDFSGYTFNEDVYSKMRTDGTYVSSNYTKAWLFFSDTQIHTWVFDFHLDKTLDIEETQEFFYKDVTSLSTSIETSKVKVYVPAQGCGKKASIVEHNVNETRFHLVVPGSIGHLYYSKHWDYRCIRGSLHGVGISVPMENTEENNNRVHAMKQKLREKKA